MAGHIVVHRLGAGHPAKHSSARSAGRFRPCAALTPQVCSQAKCLSLLLPPMPAVTAPLPTPPSGMQGAGLPGSDPQRGCDGWQPQVLVRGLGRGGRGGGGGGGSGRASQQGRRAGSRWGSMSEVIYPHPVCVVACLYTNYLLHSQDFFDESSLDPQDRGHALPWQRPNCCCRLLIAVLLAFLLPS